MILEQLGLGSDPLNGSGREWGATIMTQMRPTDQYVADLFFPNRHAHLSLY